MSESDPDAVVRAMLLATTRGDFASLEPLLAPEFTEEYPQSGERLGGRESVLGMLKAHPTPPQDRSEPRVTMLGEGMALAEEPANYGDARWWIVSLVEVRDGLARHERAFFGEEFAAPEWRAQWVEPLPSYELSHDPGGHQQVDRRLVERYVAALADSDFDLLGRMRHPDWVGDLPQSRERFRGHLASVAADRAFPGGAPSVETARVSGADDRWELGPGYQLVRFAGRAQHWLVEGVSTYPDGRRYDSLVVIEFRDDRVITERSYFFAPFEPPAWRRPFVEHA
jgi:hypothetical protein